MATIWVSIFSLQKSFQFILCIRSNHCFRYTAISSPYDFGNFSTTLCEVYSKRVRLLHNTLLLQSFALHNVSVQVYNTILYSPELLKIANCISSNYIFEFVWPNSSQHIIIFMNNINNVNYKKLINSQPSSYYRLWSIVNIFSGYESCGFI